MKRLLWVLAALLSFSFTYPANAVNPRLRMHSVALSPGVGIFLPNAAVGTAIGSKLGITNSKTVTYIWSTFGTVDQTNPQTIAQAYYSGGDPATHCEFNAGTAKMNCGGAGQDTGSVGIVLNFNTDVGTSGVELSGSLSTVPTNGIWTTWIATFNAATGNWALAKNRVDQNANITAIVNNVTPDINGDTITTTSCTACGAWMGNLPGAPVSVTSGLGLWIVAEKFYGCTGVGAPASITGIGTVTCPAANVVPVEVINKILTGSGQLLDVGAAGVNFDSARTPEVVMRFRSGSLLLNEGTATYGSGTMSLVKTGSLAATYGPFEFDNSPGAPSGIYPAIIAQGHQTAPATTSGSITQTTGSQTPNIGDAEILTVVGRTNGAGAPTGTAWTCPSGWTKIQPAVDTTGWVAAAICYRIAIDTNTSFTATWASAAHNLDEIYASLSVYRGASGFDAGANANKCNTSTGVTLSGPSGVVTTANNSLVVTSFFAEQGGRAYTTASARVHFWNPQASGVAALTAVMDKIQVTAGSVTADTITSPSNDGWSTCTLTLNP